MALIDELREKLKDVETYIAARHAQIREHGSALEELERQRWDLDIAIAALEPTPAAVTEPEPEPEPQDDASEFSEEGYAPVVEAEPLADPIWNEPEPTKPEADALAKAADYYSPEAVAERNKFNPFAMFRKEGDQ
jgi:hypothetical protein